MREMSQMSGPDNKNLHRLFIATPCYGGMLTDQYFHSIIILGQELSRLKIDYGIYTIRNESLVTRARNSLVAMFLESSYTDLIFIDSDIRFDPASVPRMLASGKPVIGGAYSVKQIPPRYTLSFCFDGDPADRNLVADKGDIEVAEIGTGFLLIRREVLEKMMEAYPDLKYTNDISTYPEKLGPFFYTFFDTVLDPVSRRYLSEDYAFCRRWRDIGGRVWLDPKTVLDHIGSNAFSGNVNELFAWEGENRCRLRGPVVFKKPADHREPGNP
jgi:hypothetical protein